MSKIEKVFNYMKIVRKATSIQIREVSNTVAPASMMGDLRKRGCNIASKLLYTTEEGVAIWQYEILSWPVKL